MYYESSAHHNIFLRCFEINSSHHCLMQPMTKHKSCCAFMGEVDLQVYPIHKSINLGYTFFLFSFSNNYALLADKFANEFKIPVVHNACFAESMCPSDTCMFATPKPLSTNFGAKCALSTCMFCWPKNSQTCYCQSFNNWEIYSLRCQKAGHWYIRPMY